MGLSKMSGICKGCPNYDNCSNKQLEACAVIKPEEPLIQQAAASLVEPASAEVLVKHDYRDVKIAPNTTVTIDLEDVKKKLEEDFYKNAGLNCFKFGS